MASLYLIPRGGCGSRPGGEYFIEQDMLFRKEDKIHIDFIKSYVDGSEFIPQIKQSVRMLQQILFITALPPKRELRSWRKVRLVAPAGTVLLN